MCWVQCSLPCVNNSGLGSYAPEPMAIGNGDIPMKDYLQKRIGIGGSRRGNHLGCRNGQAGDCSTDSVAIGYRCWQRIGAGMKRKLPFRQRKVLCGEIQPDLSRKIYSVCCHFFQGGIQNWINPTGLPVHRKKQKRAAIPELCGSFSFFYPPS